MFGDGPSSSPAAEPSPLPLGRASSGPLPPNNSNRGTTKGRRKGEARDIASGVNLPARFLFIKFARAAKSIRRLNSKTSKPTSIACVSPLTFFFFFVLSRQGIARCHDRGPDRDSARLVRLMERIRSALVSPEGIARRHTSSGTIRRQHLSGARKRDVSHGNNLHKPDRMLRSNISCSIGIFFSRCFHKQTAALEDAVFAVWVTRAALIDWAIVWKNSWSDVCDDGPKRSIRQIKDQRTVHLPAVES